MPIEPSRRRPDDNSPEPNEITVEKKNELNKLENQTIKKVEKGSLESGLKEFFNSSVDITIVSVKDMVKSKEDLDKIKDALKVSFKNVADNYFDTYNKFDVSKFRSDFGLNKGSSGSLKLPSSVKIDNIDNIDSTANDILGNMGSALAKIGENYTPGIKKKLYDSSAPNFTEGSSQDQINDSESYADSVASTVTPEQERRYKDDKTAAEIKEITDPTGDTTKNESRWTLKDIVKYAGIFIGAFKFVSLLWILINYALSHCGCMRYSCDKGDTVPIGYKAFCWVPGDKSAFQKILNPTSGVLDFSSDRCTCNLNDQGSNKCNQSTCENVTNNKLAPYFNGCPNEKFKCKGEPDKGCPVTYYSFRLFNPMQIFPDAGDNVINKGPKILEMIIHAAIVIGIILGVLLVLWIIYKVVANRKPAETLKIENTGGSKFGNRGYLGNLSKYSNYAYMGRCVPHPAKPYIPSRFKF